MIEKTMTVAEYRVILANLESLRQSIDSLKLKETTARNRWLDTNQVCQELRISRRQLQNYRDQALFPFSQFGNKIYYRWEDIEAFLIRNMKKG